MISIETIKTMNNECTRMLLKNKIPYDIRRKISDEIIQPHAAIKIQRMYRRIHGLDKAGYVRHQCHDCHHSYWWPRWDYGEENIRLVYSENGTVIGTVKKCPWFCVYSCENCSRPVSTNFDIHDYNSDLDGDFNMNHAKCQHCGHRQEKETY